MNAKLTRQEFASILANALPDSALLEINNVSDGSIPDVYRSTRAFTGSTGGHPVRLRRSRDLPPQLPHHPGGGGRHPGPYGRPQQPDFVRPGISRTPRKTKGRTRKAGASFSMKIQKIQFFIRWKGCPAPWPSKRAGSPSAMATATRPRQAPVPRPAATGSGTPPPAPPRGRRC